MFRFDPDEYVNVTLFGLNFEGRVQRCIWNGRRNLYDVEYCEAVWGRTAPLRRRVYNERARGWRADARRLVERAKEREA